MEEERRGELVAEVELGEVDVAAVDVLRNLVDKFKGNAEMLYRDGRWVFRVYRVAKPRVEPPVKPPVKVVKPRVYKKPTPPSEFIEDVVKDVASKDPSLLEKPIEVMRMVRDAAREKGYRPTVAPGLVKLILKRLKKV